jgi:hypothetical protein
VTVALRFPLRSREARAIVDNSVYRFLLRRPPATLDNLQQSPKILVFVSGHPKETRKNMEYIYRLDREGPETNVRFEDLIEVVGFSWEDLVASA